MKKLLAVLLALMVVGGAFAQATVNGYVRTIGTITQDTFTIAERLRLAPSWKSEDGNVSFSSRLELNNWATGAIQVRYAFGKIKLADGKVVVSGGRLWNFDYDISSGLSDYSLGNVENGAGYGLFAATDGMIFQVLPMEGLSIGLLVNPDGTKVAMDQMAVAASYTISGIGDVILSYAANDPTDTSALSASFKYTGVENLSVALGYKGLSETELFALVDYSMDALTAQLGGEFNLDTENLYVETTVDYAVGDNLVVRGLFGYDKNGLVLGEALKESKFFVGAEFMYNIGNGQLALNVSYDDYAGFSLPLVVKVKF